MGGYGYQSAASEHGETASETSKPIIGTVLTCQRRGNAGRTEIDTFSRIDRNTAKNLTNNTVVHDSEVPATIETPRFPSSHPPAPGCKQPLSDIYPWVSLPFLISPPLKYRFES